MGVPALFRWLSAKYPKIVEQVVEAPRLNEAGDPITVDLTDPNPNGCEFDNLYLDMNGIIHPCCHPMDKEAPATEEHMMLEIFTYLDRIFAMIRPRRLLFMAIDGVAPRAKMNQQRSRRFRAARERREKAELAAQVRAEAGPLASAKREEDEDASSDGDGDDFDSNCITPGTKFMALVAASLRYYIAERMSREPAWRTIKVILSDASIPGEGEHKIMDYIRRQRLDPDYDPVTRHVIYGLDADLIMLSMATHEPYFRVLREDVFWEEQVKYTPCGHCGEKGHAPETCPVRRHNDPTFRPRPPGEKPFIFLDVAVLREYLAAELTPPAALPFAWDLERAIDDWIFMCFFVGNDFLPHMPCLEIREGAIDVLIEIYKANAERMGGFICQDGDVDLRRVQYILNDLARVEERIFQLRRVKDQRRNEGIRKRKFAEIERDVNSSSTAIGAASGDSSRSNREAAQALKEQLRRQAEIDTEEPQDEVRLWERGGKARYYQNKFKVEQSDAAAVSEIVKAYVEGLCWVMAYYYQGCPSWKWFYPYHFAPLAEDMRGVDGMQPHFELGVPFRPFDQLMGVFPADSKELVPKPFRRLMTAEDSEVIDFYPTDFAIDLNGKKHLWQGVVLLPFIDEERLLRALETVYPEVAADDLAMNVQGTDQVFFSLWHPVTTKLIKSLDDSLHRIPLDPQETGGLAGYVQREEAFPEPGGTFPSPLLATDCPAIEGLQVACFKYYVPYHERPRLRHKAILLPYAKRPEPTLSSEDIEAIKSGAASRRVPGRLNLDLGSAASHGRHSMHQEYSRQYDRRDGGGRGYYDRYRGMGGEDRRQESTRYPSSRHAPPSRPSEPPRDRHSALVNNPYGALEGGAGTSSLSIERGGPGQAGPSSAPPMPKMQPAMGTFHRGPPPDRYPPSYSSSSGEGGGHRPEWNGNRLSDLYGRYPPPSK